MRLLCVSVALTVLPAAPALADGPPPESPGCQTYGCYWSRDGAHVMWPGHYDPERRAMWDDVAYCESTWRWGIDSTYDGGLQFHPTTWRAYGGEQFAGYAWQALPEEQIAVAERVAFYGYVTPDHRKVEPQGPRAWPHCGRELVSP